MSVRIEVGEEEPIADALKRFQNGIRADGGLPLNHHYKWHKKRLDYYQKPSVYRRRRRWVTFERTKRRGGLGPTPELDWVEDLFLRPDWAWSGSRSDGRSTRSPSGRSAGKARHARQPPNRKSSLVALLLFNSLASNRTIRDNPHSPRNHSEFHE